MNISSTPLGFLEYWGIYSAKRRFGGTRGGHNPPGRAWASWHALVGYPLLRTPPRCNQGPISSFWSIKNLRKFHGIWTPSVLISCDVKNMQKTTLGTWHYVSRYTKN